jgi:hypothetical protein
MKYKVHKVHYEKELKDFDYYVCPIFGMGFWKIRQRIKKTGGH